jgi:hypothetical protein
MFAQQVFCSAKCVARSWPAFLPWATDDFMNCGSGFLLLLRDNEQRQ